MSTHFAVIGAGGLGNPMLAALASNPTVKSLIVLTRAGSSSNVVLPDSAVKVEVDYTDISALTATFERHGTQVIISTLASSGAAAQFRIADAAKAAGVQLFVPSEFSSPPSGTETEGPTALKNSVAAHLKSIGLPFIRVFNGAFLQFIPWLFALETGKINSLPGVGDTDISITSINDVAGFLAHILTTQAPSQLARKTPVIRIQGQGLTLNAVAAVFKDKPEIVHVDDIPGKDYYEGLFKTSLQRHVGNGRIDVLWGLDSRDEKNLSNDMWPGHTWETVQDAYGD